MKKVITSGEYTLASVQGRAVLDAVVEDTGWRTGYMQRVKKLAETDFAAGIRMGEEYRGMEEAAMTAYISPDRAAAFAQTEAAIREAPGRAGPDSYCQELPGGGRADITIGAFPSADVYDRNGECIASYSSLSGWTEHQTIAEREFWRESRDTYLAAWNAAMAAGRPRTPRKAHMDITA